jgi:hypothetical protein
VLERVSLSLSCVAYLTIATLNNFLGYRQGSNYDIPPSVHCSLFSTRSNGSTPRCDSRSFATLNRLQKGNKENTLFLRVFKIVMRHTR